MDQDNAKLEWQHIRIDEIMVNGVRVPFHIDWQAPRNGLFLVRVDEDGHEIGRLKIEIDEEMGL